MLHGEERGEFFDAGWAPGGPEIEQDYLAAVVSEVDAAGAVADLECGCGLVDVCGVCSAVAACAECECGD